MNKDNRARISWKYFKFRVNCKLKRDLEKEADEQERTESALVRLALREYLARARKAREATL